MTFDETTIRNWLEELGWAATRIEDPVGDVSPRRYVRIELADGDPVIIAIYPEGHRESHARYLATTDLLARAGVHVPRILATSSELGLMALEDGGRHTLYDRHSHFSRELEPFLESAAEVAATISRLDPGPVSAINDPLGTTLLATELEQSKELVLRPRGLCGDDHQGEALNQAFASMCGLLEAAQKPCHRDLMVRNLMPRGARDVLVLDHQDLRLGPPLYDLASLLNDTIVAPPDFEEQLVSPYARDEESRLSYHRAAAQRLVKIAGTFESFGRRGYPHHLPLIRPSLRRALDHLDLLPEMAVVRSWLRPLWEELLH